MGYSIMKNILFLNHKEQQCGVYQYGYRTASILKRSKQFNFSYHEIDYEYEFYNLIESEKPDGIIYNYHPSTMGWLNNNILSSYFDITHYGIHHEGNEIENIKFDNYILSDSSSLSYPNKFPVPRPLFPGATMPVLKDEIPVIASFGFGFKNKGFERLVKLVNEQFDEAIIKLHIPFAHYGDKMGTVAKSIASACQSHITKDKIKLIITHDFLSDSNLLEFLSNNTINAFLYDQMPGRGLSSVIDYALSVNVPIAITDTFMFRHISKTNPSICVENSSLQEIINNGSSVLQDYRHLWSNSNLISVYESILLQTLKSKKEYPKVLIAILARDKENCLETYLDCIKSLDYPKNKICLYIRTNNNKDKTKLLLDNFLNNNYGYFNIEYDASDEDIELNKYTNHEWNELRFSILGKIRNTSLKKTLQYNCDFYFVADCDNFILPHTLKKLVDYNLPVVAPFLRNDQGSLYSNYHVDVNEYGYYKDNPLYTDIFSNTITGIIQVKVVHCTYLVRADVIPKLTYTDETERHEYVIFSDSARKAGIPQYIDNTEKYGILTFKIDNEIVDINILKTI